MMEWGEAAGIILEISSTPISKLNETVSSGYAYLSPTEIWFTWRYTFNVLWRYL